MPEPTSLPTPMKTTVRLEQNNTAESGKYAQRPPRELPTVVLAYSPKRPLNEPPTRGSVRTRGFASRALPILCGRHHRRH
jgi:hypothetical protein